MANFDASQYGPVFAELVQGNRLRSLGEGSPDETVRLKLESLSVRDAFAHTNIDDPDMASCCLSALWLLHDLLDDSHTISQGVETESGSFWHGIMHRREGDFSNAKYWFRKVGDHSVYGLLAEQVRELGEEAQLTANGLTADGQWDPFRFVDACQSAVSSGGSEAASCQRIQQLEWELLFDFCYHKALA